MFRSLPYFQPWAGVKLMIKGALLVVDGNKSRVPTFAQIQDRILQPRALWGGWTNFAPFRDSLNQVAHLGSAQKQCMSNACKYFTFFLPRNVMQRLQILCSFCAMPNAITLITKAMFVCTGNIFLESYFWLTLLEYKSLYLSCMSISS